MSHHSANVVTRRDNIHCVQPVQSGRWARNAPSAADGRDVRPEPVTLRGTPASGRHPLWDRGPGPIYNGLPAEVDRPGDEGRGHRHSPPSYGTCDAIGVGLKPPNQSGVTGHCNLKDAILVRCSVAGFKLSS
jgi:hypothetical protein